MEGIELGLGEEFDVILGEASCIFMGRIGETATLQVKDRLLECMGQIFIFKSLIYQCQQRLVLASRVSLLSLITNTIDSTQLSVVLDCFYITPHSSYGCT
jgi:hypothetical protein